MTEDLFISNRITIPASELEWSFARSSGPGGQNVNKVNSKAILKWNPSASIAMPQEIQERFLSKYRSRISVEGIFLLSSQKYRDQLRNIIDCREKLRCFIESVATPPRKRIRRTAPTKAQKEKRLESKRQTSEKKQARRKPNEW